MKSKEVTVLLVDDDEIDRTIVTRAFQKARIVNTIVETENGIEALEALRGTDGKPRLEQPFLVLLDINMPKMGGLEFLRELRDDVNLSNTIVFVLTTSDHDEDKWSAYEMNVAGYVVKDRVGHDFLRLIEMLDHYWKVVEFPMERTS